MILTQEVSQAAENVICLKIKTTLIQSPNKKLSGEKETLFCYFSKKSHLLKSTRNCLISPFCTLLFVNQLGPQSCTKTLLSFLTFPTIKL